MRRCPFAVVSIVCSAGLLAPTRADEPGIPIVVIARTEGARQVVKSTQAYVQALRRSQGAAPVGWAQAYAQHAAMAQRWVNATEEAAAIIAQRLAARSEFTVLDATKYQEQAGARPGEAPPSFPRVSPRSPRAQRGERPQPTAEPPWAGGPEMLAMGPKAIVEVSAPNLPNTPPTPVQRQRQKQTLTITWRDAAFPQRSGRLSVAPTKSQVQRSADSMRSALLKMFPAPPRKTTPPDPPDTAIRWEIDGAAMVAVPATDDAPKFYIDRFEVSNARYKRFLDATGTPAPPHWKEGAFGPGLDQHPVVGVTREEAEAYCRWAGKRLPSSSEWKRAAGAGKSAYPWGSKQKWSNWCNWFTSRGGPAPGGGFPRDASAYGAMDMAGNVREWTSNCEHAIPIDQYSDFGQREWNDKVRLETAGMIRFGFDRFVVGGSWLSPREPQLPWFSWLQNRAAGKWVFRGPDNVRYPDLGFRCASDLDWESTEPVLAELERAETLSARGDLGGAASAFESLLDDRKDIGHRAEAGLARCMALAMKRAPHRALELGHQVAGTSRVTTHETVTIDNETRGSIDVYLSGPTGRILRVEPRKRQALRVRVGDYLIGVRPHGGTGQPWVAEGRIGESVTLTLRR